MFQFLKDLAVLVHELRANIQSRDVIIEARNCRAHRQKVEDMQERALIALEQIVEALRPKQGKK